MQRSNGGVLGSLGGIKDVLTIGTVGEIYIGSKRRASIHGFGPK